MKTYKIHMDITVEVDDQEKETQNETIPDVPESEAGDIQNPDEAQESTETPAEEAEDEDQITISYPILVSLSPLPDAGKENHRILQNALDAGDVRLVEGEYVIDPGIDIDGVTLDLNGSHLKSSKLRDNGALFYMLGELPAIMNGRLSGNYSAAPGEDGYCYWEAESAIRLVHGGCGDVIIRNVKFDHWCGYAVCGDPALRLGDCVDRRVVMYPENAAAAKITDIDPEYKYVTARHAIGYNYQISDESIKYEFETFAGTTCAVVGVPGKSILIPKDTTTIRVTTHKNPNAVPYGVFFYKHNNNVIIEDCEFWCNQHLGIANLIGYSEVMNCKSWSNGYPREDHKDVRWECSTSGFMDIEDIQTPRLSINGCSSKDENLGVASRAYELFVSNSPDLKVRIYGGWLVDAADGCNVIYNSADAAFGVAVHSDETVKIDETLITDNTSRVEQEIGNLPIIPDGAMYDDCKFLVTSTKTLWYGKRITATFKDCIIDLNCDWFVSYGHADLTFEDCLIYLNGHSLINQKAYDSGKLVFKNCKFDVDVPENLTTGCDVSVKIS